MKKGRIKELRKKRRDKRLNQKRFEKDVWIVNQMSPEGSNL